MTSHPRRAILIDVFPREMPRAAAERALGEIRRLVETAGGVIVVHVLQRRGRPSAKTYVGTGKAAEVAALAKELKADLVIVNGMLRASQAMHLGKIVQVPVWDRIEVILAIFAEHARTGEAKLQVELARLRYELPKLYGRGVEFSRIGGGAQTRGAGEQFLEIQKRTIKRRIHDLAIRLEQVRTVRRTQRERRARHALRTIAVVGYTNVGKSSLVHALAGKDILVADQLFSTLDTRLGRLRPDASATHAPPILLADTIGFIQDLPPSLLASFRSTLEEVEEADALVEVIDASDPLAEEKHAVVDGILTDLGVADLPRIVVLNKLDAAADVDLDAWTQRVAPHQLLGVSVLAHQGIDALRRTLQLFAGPAR